MKNYILTALIIVLIGCATVKKEHCPTCGPGLTANTAITNPEYLQYTVAEKDCLWDISRGTYSDSFLWPAMAKENGIKNPDLIVPGQVIRIKTNLTEFERRVYRRKAFLYREKIRAPKGLLP